MTTDGSASLRQPDPLSRYFPETFTLLVSVVGRPFVLTTILNVRLDDDLERGPEWKLSGEFGADGTPMTVPLDAEGRIASPVVTGCAAVLKLRRR